MEGDTGVEPVHHGVKVHCLTNLANPQLNGVEGEIRTHGGRDLQSLALGHSATSTCLASVHGFEPRLVVLETIVLPLTLHRENMVARTGIEPVTHTLSRWRSTAELTGYGGSYGI